MTQENSEQISVAVGSSIAARSQEPGDSPAAPPVDAPPQPYAIDGISLLVHSPTKLLLCWNHAHDPFDTLRKAFGSEAAHYRLTVRLVDVDSGHESFYEASQARVQWFDATPGRAYKAHIGFIALNRPSIHLFTSGVVRTPRPGISYATDTADQFVIPRTSFVRLLSEAGYVSDALEVALEAN